MSVAGRFLLIEVNPHATPVSDSMQTVPTTMVDVVLVRVKLLAMHRTLVIYS